jgi:outer membrane PBP1 activator LpoA protein
MDLRAVQAWESSWRGVVGSDMLADKVGDKDQELNRAISICGLAIEGRQMTE